MACIYGRPLKCPRGLDTCTPKGLIDTGETFVCAGVHDKQSKYVQDIYRHCWYTEDLDSMIDMDKRDVWGTINVLEKLNVS